MEMNAGMYGCKFVERRGQAKRLNNGQKNSDLSHGQTERGMNGFLVEVSVVTPTTNLLKFYFSFTIISP